MHKIVTFLFLTATILLILSALFLSKPLLYGFFITVLISVIIDETDLIRERRRNRGID